MRIDVLNLKKYFGRVRAVDDISFSFTSGQIFGFIGPNGAGKTSTMRILATLDEPTAGDATIDGVSVVEEPERAHRLVGYVPDYFGAYEDMVVQEYLEFFAAAYNINGSARVKLVNDVLDLTDLGHKRDSLVDGLSRGMKQRLSVARVLLHDPKLLLLDEPAGNLDPRARIELRELLKTLRGMGKTIIISSHILPELQDLCNTVGIIERGELIYSGPWTDIVKKARTGTILHVAVKDNQAQAGALLAQDENIESVQPNNGFLEISIKSGIEDYSFVPQRLVQNGYRLMMLREEEVNLETAFMRLTKGMVQ